MVFFLTYKVYFTLMYVKSVFKHLQMPDFYVTVPWKSPVLPPLGFTFRMVRSERRVLSWDKFFFFTLGLILFFLGLHDAVYH